MSESIIEGYRLSPQQHRLWTLKQADTAASYGARCAVLIEGPLDAPRLRDAVSAVVERHEILRTAFELLPGADAPVQVIGEGRLAWDEPRDLRDLGEREQEREVEAVSAREGETGEVTASLLRLGEDRHVLVLRLSALCLDKAGMQSLARELSLAYGGAPSYAGGDEEEPLQYADLSEWQNELLESNETEAGRRHWQREGLADLLDVKLPLESRRRAGARGFTPRRQGFTLGADVAARVTALAARLEVSEASFWLACWQALVWRVTGQAEVIIGTGFDGRRLDGLEGALGLLTRYLPLSARTSDDMRFADLLTDVERRLSEAREWQEYFSWEQAAPAEGNGRGHAKGNGHAPQPHYCAVCFDFVAASESYAAGGARFSLWREYACTERFKLKLSVLRGADDFHATLYYDASLFDPEEVQRLSARLLRLAEAAVASPASTIGRLPLLPDAERRLVVEKFNPAVPAASHVECIHRLIEEQARRRPQTVAVVSEEGELTYGELNRRANQLAHRLKELGVGPEVRVGVLLERSLEMIVALLGVLKAGGAYVPVDLDYPADRIAYMLENADARVLLTRTGLAARLPEHDAHALFLDAEAEELARQSDENPEGGAEADNLAYVIYTSGSTGRPKGVGVTHRNVARLFASTQNWFGFDERDVWTFFHSYAFDFSVWEIWGALVYGGRLVVVSYWVSRSPDEFYKLLCAERVTVLNQTPSSFRQLIRAEDASELYADLSLRLVIFGGEALEFQALRPWFDRHGDEQPQLVNMYGITETTVHVTYFPLSIADLHRHSGSIIGSQIPDLQLYVLDRHAEPAPLGVAGELYVGGHGLARGYLNRPGLTAERFVPDPFSGETGARLYRTGDLARHLPDGTLEYLGRADDQVKIRGFRIELGEIEAALAAHPSVAEAVTAVKTDASGDKRLVSYIVPRAGDEAAAGSGRDTTALRSFLRERLPDYMMPAAIVVLERMPLTANGKVDRRALPEPHEVVTTTSAYAAPRTPTEELICGMWAEVLGVERVGVADDFFELGGHSLLATRVSVRVRETFGVELPLRTLFENPTPAGLAAAIDETPREDGGAPAPPIQPVPRGEGLPLSFAQERLWFLDQLEPGNPFYNVPFAVRLTGALDAAALERTFSEIVRRHEALRTTFSSEAGRPSQITHDEVPFRFELKDISQLPAAEREAEARRLTRDEAAQPFDLSAGPLVRAALLRLADDEHVLLCTMHHIVSDGWSLGVLVEEVGALYEAFAEGRPSPLPALPVQYADYAAWQRGWLQGEELERQLAYWRQQLDGVPPALELPTDRPRPLRQSHRGVALDFHFSPELTPRLHALARAEGATLFMVLLGCWQLLLARYSGREEVAVGTPVANRRRRELEGLVGFFVNTLVLRTDLSGDPTLAEAVRRAREVCLGAYQHQDVPFEKLVEELRPERSLGHSPLFQVMFSMNAQLGERLHLGPLQLETVRSPERAVKFDMTVTLEETNDGTIAGTLAYSTDLFDEATMRRLLAAYERVLSAAAEDSGRRASAVALLDEEERRQTLEEGNQTRREYARAETVHELFEAQAARTPDRLAVVCGPVQLTYAELERRADNLSHRLREAGVGPEVNVGLLLERSPEMVVGLLATLKAGGAYVALAPQETPEALAELLKAARVQVLLTKEALATTLPEHSARLVFVDAPQFKGNAARHTTTATSGAACVNLVPTPEGRLVGVVNTHAAVCNAFRWAAETGLVAEGDRVLQCRSLRHEAAAETLWTLLAGATLIMPGSPQTFDGARLRHLLEAERVTVVHCTPAQLAALCEGDDAKAHGQLRRVVCSGGALADDLRARFAEAYGAELHHLYGADGAAAPATSWLCVGGPAGGFAHVGRSVANTRSYVLDRFMEPVPAGVVGELYVGGRGLARGYFDLPDLTAERFVPDPFSTEPGARLQRTGDLARYLPGGNIELVGRSGRLAEVGGFRVDLERVEAALLSHDSVREAAAALREGAGGGAQLVGYVVARDEAPAVGDLRAHLAGRLPYYATPAVFVVLDRMPLTPSGEVDRGALPAPAVALPEASFVEAQTPMEELVIGVWREVLGVERIGVNDNFFDLGGRSLLITQAHSRLQQLLGRQLALVELFKYPSVSALAEYLSGGDAGESLVAQGDQRAELRRSMRRRRNLQRTT